MYTRLFVVAVYVAVVIVLYRARNIHSTYEARTRYREGKLKPWEYSPYSSLWCHGDNGVSAAVHQRTCLLQNICYVRDSSTSRWVFYYNSSSPTFNFFEGRKRSVLPVGHVLVNLQAYQEGLERYWVPDLSNDTVPNDLFHLTEVNMLFHMFWPENFGHMLVDDVMAAYWALSMFSINTQDVQLIGSIMCDGIFIGSDLARCERFYAQVLPSFSRHPLVSLPALVGNKSTMCFKRLVVGIGMRTMRDHNPALRQQFREQVLVNLGRNPYSAPPKDLIVFLLKKGRRAPLNTEEAFNHIRTSFPEVTCELVNVTDMTFREQVFLMLRTTVLITPCGGMSLIALFLNPGAVSIFIDFYNPSLNATDSMEGWAHQEAWFVC